MLKPRVIRRGDRWYCHDDHRITGVGFTPRAAYFSWLDASNRQTRIPRHGIWAKQGCVSWYLRGCPAISSYVDGKRIVGYDRMSDELILQG